MSEIFNLMKRTFYSNKEIFLCELINNACNALDKSLFERLTGMNNLHDELFIRLVPQKENKTLLVIDNGIGMTKDDLIHNLDVGFYSTFLVAEKVNITSKYNDLRQYIWESQPDGSFIVTKDINAQHVPRGTKITLFLKDDQLEYLEEATIKNLVNKHCQLITHPIYLWSENTKDHWQVINFWHKQEMENTSVAQKCHNHLPDDLTFLILVKLPLKSLKRFGSLCKSWALLFENSLFVDLFHINFISNHNSFYDDTSIILCLKEIDTETNHKPSFFLLSGERFQNVDKLNWPNPLKGCFPELNFLGSSSVNGILCFFIYQNHSVYLWNPTTGELKVIPHSPVEYVPLDACVRVRCLGFGYDGIQDDYKVIRSVQPEEAIPEYGYTKWDYTHLFEIYSVRSNSWRKLKINITPRVEYGIIDGKFYFDGMCHWLCRIDGDRSWDPCLVSFDMRNETYYTTPTPLDIPLDICDIFNRGYMRWYLFLLNGSIALMSTYGYNTTFYISILTELDL
ncbi:Heat shock protein [Vigna angularis]|uniref:Heat shock protein n=1 Tax=Phaseolus angularis TaxID=3914 RepID=A0A8T0JTW1_PHAAN|nr:Heat shock protein [Vigna angularis]KAG2384058.1 Heat shock protein [Vigna angularis]